MTLANGVEEGGEIANVDVGGFRKLSRPGDKFRLAHIKGPVGAERRKDTSRQVRLRNRLMVAQVVDRVIGCADHLHVKFLENFLDGQTCESGVRALPDFRSRVLIQQIVDSEITLEFEMSPVIERIAQGIRDRSRPSQEFLVRGGVAGDVFFRDAVCTHGAPLVVIPFEPDFEQIFETAILREIFRREMTVVVENRLRGGVLMVEPASDVVGKQEIFAEEGGHDGTGFMRS